MTEPFDGVYNSAIKLNQFKLIKIIGEGELGVVYMAEYINNKKLYALKFIKVTKVETVEPGLYLSKTFDHPNLVKSYGFFLENYNDQLCIVSILEYIEGTNLLEICLARDRKDIINLVPIILPQIISGLKYIHDKNLIHRDIKFENIILINNSDNDNNDNINIKIVDYDFLTHEDNATKPCGTPYYIAPEMMYKDKVDHNVDIWSLGVIIYAMLTDEFPFEGDTNQDLFQNISTQPLYTVLIPSEYYSIVTGMLEKIPYRRKTLDSVLEDLKKINS